MVHLHAALRHYDRIGLLKPATTDEWTGYRYYRPEQLSEIRRILALKELGFSLAEIRTIVGGEADLPALLDRRSVELEREIHERESRLERVRAYLSKTQEGKAMQERVTIKSLPAVIVASMRTTVAGYDAFFEVVPMMGAYMRSVGAECREPEYCFTIFHNDEYRKEDIDVEICEAVTAPRQDSEQVKFKRHAAVTAAACVTHRGPYKRIGESYNDLFRWIEEEGYDASGHPRESYIDGIWNHDDPEEWLTEIQVPGVARGEDVDGDNRFGPRTTPPRALEAK